MGYLEFLLSVNVDHLGQAAHTCKCMASVAWMFHVSISLFMTQAHFGTYSFLIKKLCHP